MRILENFLGIFGVIFLDFSKIIWKNWSVVRKNFHQFQTNKENKVVVTFTATKKLGTWKAYLESSFERVYSLDMLWVVIQNRHRK